MIMRTHGLIALAALSLTLGCATGKIWQRWDIEGQKRYFGLSCVAGDSALAEYRALSEPELRDEWYRSFWSRGHDGIANVEHQRRLEYAWQEFSGEQCFRDDRARVYVRYGEPADRWRSTSTWRYLNSKQLAGGSMMRERPWEVWQYPDQGSYFDFIEFNQVYRIWATLRLDRRHPIAFFDTSRTPVASRPPSAGGVPAHRPLESQWARFRSPSAPGKVRWELYWRVPLEAVSDGRAAVAFTLSDAIGKQTADTVSYDVIIPADSLLEPYAYGQRNLDLDPGHYRMEIAVRTGSGAVFRSQTEAELVAYQPGIQECSDVELVLLQDTTMISRIFQKGKYKRVIPDAVDEIPTRQPYFVYYEAYNLGTDSKGNHQVKVRLQVYQSGRDTLAERPFAAGEFTFEEPGAEFHGCHCVYPRDLGAGDVYLLISVEDRISGRVTKLIKTFRLKEP
jgi:GWxTD domain-containing protein